MFRLQKIYRSPGGLLALRSNIGSSSNDEFSVVPKVTVKVGYQVNNALRGFVGYDFLYWSAVVRPGKQIDTVVDESLIPNFNPSAVSAGQDRPGVLFRESDFWVQGLTTGLELRY